MISQASSSCAVAGIRRRCFDLSLALLLAACFTKPLSAQQVSDDPAAISVTHRLELTSGGLLEGCWLNRDEPQANQYEIATPSGVLHIDHNLVSECRSIEPAETEYDRLAPTYGNSAEEQWDLAEWCLAHNLPDQRRLHLQHVIAIDPDNPAARAGLGYTFLNGRWVIPRDAMQQRGFVQSEGEWRFSQEIELRHQRRRQQQLAVQWANKVEHWREQIVVERDASAREELLGTVDPHVVAAIHSVYGQEPYWGMRTMYVETVCGVAKADEFNEEAVKFLVQVAIEDPHLEVRLAAVEGLERLGTPLAVPPLLEALRSNDNTAVNRAALALGRLHDGTAIEPLIDRLITSHHYVIGDNSGATTSAFSHDGREAHYATARQQVITQTLQNQEVLRALIRLSSVNYGFDPDAWQVWLETQKAADSPVIQARRD